MNNGLGLLSSEASEPSFSPKADPRLRLLRELEPAHRVFLGNLTDLVLRRGPNGLAPMPSAGFGSEIFVTQPIPWGAFVESLAYHAIAIALYLGLSSLDASRPQVTQFSHREPSHVIYYPAAKSAPAPVPPQPPRPTARREASQAAKQRPLAVPPEQHGRAPALVTPPDIIAAARNRAPELPLSNPAAPSVPLDATGRPRSAPAVPTSVVAPPPDLAPGASGPRGSLQGSVVAPPPDVDGISGPRAGSGPNTGVVAPPPSLASTGLSRRGIAGAPAQVVSPAPDLAVQGSRKGPGSLAGAGNAVVPPPPSVASGTNGHGVGNSLASQVVPPPPALSGSASGTGHRAGLPGSGPDVVPPPPALSGAGNGAGRHMSAIAGSGPGIVPPPPVVPGEGTHDGGRGHGLGGLGSQIVPPPPSLAGGNRGGGRGGSLSGIGADVVPPPPSLSGSGNGNGRLRSGSGTGTQVVPPPVALGSGGGLKGQGASLAGPGAQVVPPPPSLGQGGGGTRGHGTGLASASAVVPPPPSLSGAGTGLNGNGHSGGMSNGAPGGALPPNTMGSTSTGPLEQMDPLDTSPQPPPAPTPPPELPGEDLPFRLVALAIGTPGSSFFSNYEVFIAERRFGKSQRELVKLVYTFLPYQKRLSEYVRDSKRVYKLRVLRDPSCDETLMQMTWPEGTQPPAEALGSADQPAAATPDKNPRLPCFRTSADDYMRALERGR